MKPILFNISDSRALRSTGLYTIWCILGEAAEDAFCGRGVTLVERHESGNMPVLMDSWNKSVKMADSSLAAYLKGGLRDYQDP